MSFIRKPLAALQEYCWPSTTSREEDISTETRHDQRGAQTPRKATGPLMNTVSTSPLRKLASSQMVEKVESHLSTNPRPTPDLESWSQASYGNPHDAVAIPVPGQRPMAKPNLGSSIRPRNTLNNVTKFANQNILGREGKNDRTLQTSNTRDNVPSSTRQHAQVVSKGNREDNHRDKRRKITQHPNTRAAENEIIAIDSDDDLNQSKLSSASSPVTTASQSSSRPTKSKCGQYQDMSIYNALGRAPEFRKVEKMLNSRPEYGKRQRRKSEGSRSRASNYSSTSSQTSTQGRPKVHNDSLQVENRSFNGTELVPVDRNMIFDSNHAEYDLLGPLERMLNSYGTSPSKSPYFNKDQTERQLDRKQILAVNQSENSKIAQKYVDLESQQLVEAPLRKRFIRADQPSERTTLQKAFDMIDTSEDELTMDIPKPLPSRYNESQSFTAKRSISPSKNTRTRQNSIDRSSHADIRPTTFVNSRAVSSRLLDAARSRKRFETKFKQPSWDIVSFYLPTKCLKQCDLTLVEDLDVGSFYIAQKDSLRSRMFDDGGEFNPEKLNIAEHCVTLSSKIRMTGSMSNMVKTEVCFEFSSPTTANNFLSRLSERTGDLLRFISKLPLS
ncbi:hypothetical protein M501DRAFT_530502 [Patellaria atrata CBS 101060]|uniref:Uncharacterized protein n=1 Tax=Patellaria atrata CBS 101060 TaxID=1346257 RepID=A0A9P4SEZ9_9PEZI|nr:hypothetical protein M501DRAFT_530502 [Patellaria atrata CBS 101060]